MVQCQQNEANETHDLTNRGHIFYINMINIG